MQWQFDRKTLEVALQAHFGGEVAEGRLDKEDAEAVGTAIKSFLESPEAKILRKDIQIITGGTGPVPRG